VNQKHSNKPAVSVSKLEDIFELSDQQLRDFLQNERMMILQKSKSEETKQTSRSFCSCFSPPIIVALRLLAKHPLKWPKQKTSPSLFQNFLFPKNSEKKTFLQKVGDGKNRPAQKHFLTSFFQDFFQSCSRFFHIPQFWTKPFSFCFDLAQNIISVYQNLALLFKHFKRHLLLSLIKFMTAALD